MSQFVEAIEVGDVGKIISTGERVQIDSIEGDMLVVSPRSGEPVRTVIPRAEFELNPIDMLCRMLDESCTRMTFDAANNCTLPCVRCGNADGPARQLVVIGHYARPWGGGNGPGDPISRPLCDKCVEQTKPADGVGAELHNWLRALGRGPLGQYESPVETELCAAPDEDDALMFVWAAANGQPAVTAYIAINVPIKALVEEKGSPDFEAESIGAFMNRLRESAVRRKKQLRLELDAAPK